MSTLSIDFSAAGLFLLTAIALLGSPGPGIAALVAIGRERGFAGGLRYFMGLQLGLATAAAASAFGVVAVLSLVPGVALLLTIASTSYLLWLAWCIATAPVGGIEGGGAPSGFGSGLLLGLSNPKAYLAFALLFASRSIVAGPAGSDAAGKWLLIVAVIVAVDLVWLAIGAVLRRAPLGPRSERAMNVALGLAILVATGMSVV